MITAASPADACRLDEGEHDLSSAGYMDVPSSRTVSLSIDSAWLREQQADPEGTMSSHRQGVWVPVGILHGLDDSTVDSEDAVYLAEAVGERAVMRLIDGGNHVFNTPNPADMTAPRARPCETATGRLGSGASLVQVIS